MYTDVGVNTAVDAVPETILIGWELRKWAPMAGQASGVGPAFGG